MPRRVVVHLNPPNLDCYASTRLVPLVFAGGEEEQVSGVESDLGQAEVRRYAMDQGLVDFKVAAIDAIRSGLRFSRKKL